MPLLRGDERWGLLQVVGKKIGKEFVLMVGKQRTLAHPTGLGGANPET